MVLIFPNLSLWRRSLCSNLGGIDPDKLYRATLIAMYRHVLPLIAMYYHVLPSITMYYHVSPCMAYLLPCITMYWHVLTCIA